MPSTTSINPINPASKEIPGVICLDLSEVMGATHSYKSFNTDTHQEVDADAEGNSTTKRLKL